MSLISLKENSRIDWSKGQDLNSIESITLGCMLRIADALEAMSKNYLELIGDVKYYKQESEDYRESYKKERRRVAALRGILKRKKG